MAAEIKESSPDSHDPVKPELVHKLEGCTDEVHAAILITGEDTVISISGDRSVRIWVLRDSGQYWPSVCHYMGSAATALCYTESTRQLFIGLESGTVAEFSVARDYNRIDPVREYHAHQGRVTNVIHAKEQGWILSAARDKYFQFHCIETGRRLGGYLCNAWCTAMEYDQLAQYVFVGDYSGVITVCKLEAAGVKFINMLKGHSASIRDLLWDGNKNWLYSGSFDCSVFVWDIGGRKGTVFELHGHQRNVTSLALCQDKNLLMSSSEDNNLVFWKMNETRLSSTEWSQSDNCQLCNRPFFWNFKSMYDQKQMGLRQHHRRRSGKAICDHCTSKKSVHPRAGYEHAMRVCEEGHINITPQEKESLAVFFDIRHAVTYLNFDQSRKLLLSIGNDHVIKLWDLSNFLSATFSEES